MAENDNVKEIELPKSYHNVFSAKSPVDRLADRLKAPKAKPGLFGRLTSRFKSLLDSKKTLDKVYSDGYFENHYPDADELLKNILHESTMQAWAMAKENQVEPDPEEEEEEEESKLCITINIGK